MNIPGGARKSLNNETRLEAEHFCLIHLSADDVCVCLVQGGFNEYCKYSLLYMNLGIHIQKNICMLLL